MASKKHPTFKEWYGEEQCQAIRERLEDFFNGKGGFLVIDNLELNRVTDAYMGICDYHVMHRVGMMLEDAIKIGHPGLEEHKGPHNDKH